MNNISGAGISVIVPAYRAAGTIGRALASVADQTLRPLEVIVVDDGSDDGTLEAAKSSAGLLGDIRLTVLHQYHGGAGAARNRAIMEAAGHYVAFLDADDEWLPAKLERSLPYFDDPAIVLVAHNNLHAEAGAERLNDAASRFRAAPISFVGLYRKGFIGTCTVVAKREAVLSAGGLDPELKTAQDFDLWLAMLADPANRFVVFDEALSRYHVTEGNITSHTARRLACGQIIAERHAAALKHYPGSMLFSLAFRNAAIFNEARAVYMSRCRYGLAIWTMARMPFALLKSLSVVLLGRNIHPRRDYLQPG
ncbi:MAG: glycosyltransferase family 2 protein [Rhodospirillaceae bacterium]|nr:glycosyltransferase family 2 protein [Rhodospirillaceae bacterium]MBT3885218.1 glycosyltransferase family 2 protein [Rhodospirillaceae bacterium]MBT4115492.1 glycosyltransferase family 2 protein [Rhodospirillaceae bacterium]MBT4673557.1 glycosyltransferase family 2 protein [Rhodospirillaceae bacterium]MBT4750420.1 glycosyltransferase family 2 protein [Rhodospirillaceae bacterium]